MSETITGLIMSVYRKMGELEPEATGGVNTRVGRFRTFFDSRFLIVRKSCLSAS